MSRTAILELTDPIAQLPGERRLELVVVHGKPVGTITVEGEGDALVHARIIWGALADDVNRHLLADGQEPLSALGPEGIRRGSGIAACEAGIVELIASAPRVSVVVPTLGGDSVGSCVEAVLASEYPREALEIIVVLNGEADLGVIPALPVRVLHSGRANASRARNHGLTAAQGKYVVFLDDDVIPSARCVVSLVQALESRGSAAASGLILPAELRTRAQVLLEEYGGYAKGFETIAFDLHDHRPEADPLFPFRIGSYGSGGCLAFRTETLRQAGGFDERLGPGTPTMAGEDPEILFRLVVAGETVVYEPRAYVFHQHPDEIPQLARRMRGYGVGLGAALTRSVWERPSLLLPLLRRLPKGLRYLLAEHSEKNARKSASYPDQLTRAERRGLLLGPASFLSSTARETWRRRGAGSLVALSLVLTPLALLGVALAATYGREGRSHASLLFWASLSLMAIPAAWAALSNHASRTERFSTLILFALAVYLTKVYEYPLLFQFPDEFSDWRTTDDLVHGAGLFVGNPLRETSSLFPGMALATAALSKLSGLSIFASGVLLLGIARLLLVGSLFLFFDRVTRDGRVGAVAALVVALNPNFLFFDSQFSYESLALAFAAFALWLIATLSVDVRPWRPPLRGSHSRPADSGWWEELRDDGRRVRSLGAVVIAALAALTVTHHMTAYLVALVLIVSAMYAHVRQSPEAPPLAVAAVLAASLSVVWGLVAARAVLGYLAYVFVPAIGDFLSLVTGETSSRTPFHSSGGFAPPVWERGVGTASVALIVLVLPFGLWLMWKQGAFREPFLVALALLAVTFPVFVLLRLVPSGNEAASRSSEFLFIAAAVPVALVLVRLAQRTVGCIAAVTWVLLVGMGGVILGISGPLRLPGPYLVGADQRSVDGATLSAARYASEALPRNSIVLADRMTAKTLGAYGRVDPVRRSARSGHFSLIVTSDHFGPRVRDIAWEKGIRYVVVDERDSTALPLSGYYFGASEPGAFKHTRPIPVPALHKFERIPDVDTVYDSGTIRIFDIRRAVAEAR